MLRDITNSTPRRRRSSGPPAVRVQCFLRLRSCGGTPCIAPATSCPTATLQPPPTSQAFKSHVKEEVVDFDGILHDVDQAAVFDRVARPVVGHLAAARSCVIMTFGATGSGKSFTMFGPPPALAPGDPPAPAQLGLVPRTLFAALAEVDGAADGVQVACVEVYRDTYRDLLAGVDEETGDPPVLPTCKPADTALPVAPHWHAVTSPNDVMPVVTAARTARSRASTDCNAASSRGHAVVFLRVGHAVVALVDVGGNERLKASGATAERAKEATSINASLSNLRRMMEALRHNAAHPAAPVVVPWRGSKLTALLRPVFTGMGGRSPVGQFAVVMAATDRAEDFDMTRTVLQFTSDVRGVTVEAAAAAKTHLPHRQLFKSPAGGKRRHRGARRAPPVTTSAAVCQTSPPMWTPAPASTSMTAAQTSPSLLWSIVRRHVVKQTAAFMVAEAVTCATQKLVLAATSKAQVSALQADVQRRAMSMRGLSSMLAASHQAACMSQRRVRLLEQRLNLSDSAFVDTVRRAVADGLPSPEVVATPPRRRARCASVDDVPASTTPLSPPGNRRHHGGRSQSVPPSRPSPRQQPHAAAAAAATATDDDDDSSGLCGHGVGAALFARVSGLVRRAATPAPPSTATNAACVSEQLRLAKLTMVSLSNTADQAVAERDAAVGAMEATQQHVADLRAAAAQEADQRAQLAAQLAAVSAQLATVTAERDAAWNTAAALADVAQRAPPAAAVTTQACQTLEWGVYAPGGGRGGAGTAVAAQCASPLLSPALSPSPSPSPLLSPSLPLSAASAGGTPLTAALSPPMACAEGCFGDGSMVACTADDSVIVMLDHHSVFLRSMCADDGDVEAGNDAGVTGTAAPSHHCECCIRRVLAALPSLRLPTPAARAHTAPRCLDKATRDKWWTMAAARQAVGVVPA